MIGVSGEFRFGQVYIRTLLSARVIIVNRLNAAKIDEAIFKDAEFIGGDIEQVGIRSLFGTSFA